MVMFIKKNFGIVLMVGFLYSPYLLAQELKINQKIDIEEYIKSNEGLRLKPYTDHKGHISVGYGRNLQDVGITKQMATDMLREDLEGCKRSLLKYYPWYLDRGHRVQVVMLDMCYGLGFNGLSKFKNMLKALHSEDYFTAAVELLNSDYADDLPKRSDKNALMLLEERQLLKTKNIEAY